MSSKGRKIAKNLGKSIRKKFDSDLQTDDLQQSSDLSSPQDSPIMQHFSVRGETKSSSSASPPSIAKSTSLSMIGNDQADPMGVERNEILTLTQDVKNFSDTLAKLKVLFLEGLETGDDARVVLQNALGDVLSVLKTTMQRYPDLKSPDIFTAARILINKIKAHDSEELQLDDEELQFYMDAIDQVALAFSRCVSEYLMGDMVNQQLQQQQQLNMDTKVQSCENLARPASHQDDRPPEKPEPIKMLTPEELDAILLGLEGGLDLALQRAKAWSRYTRDIIAYIEKKSQLEMEYAKNLARIAHSMQPVLSSEGFLPLQSVFCTALSQDAEFASNLQASQALLHTSKFVEPLAARRNEHDRVRKSVKETWEREVRRMQETVNNLRKAQALYISRQQELERVRETLQKAEGDKMEKRKKSEEEALHKSAEAETTYKACVAEANHRQRSLEKAKVDLLGKVRDQIHHCDQVIKKVTVEYFSLLHTVWSPVPVQYQTLCESSRGYEAGCQYAEYIRRLPSSASRPRRNDEFAFEPYSPGQKAGEARKISVHSNGSSGEHIHSNEGSPVASPRRDKYRIPVKAWGQNSGPLQLGAAGVGGSDTDSASGSNKSHESSPSSSPHNLLRRHISHTLEDWTEEDLDKLPSRARQKRGQMKRTATVGDEEGLDIPQLMGGQGRRNTTFGVDFQEQVEHYKTQVPPIITKCLAEIERRGVMIKGIYRVSGVKSKVENLCQKFDNNPEQVNLEEVHPNIISNVLKLYLRQLPEPLLTFRLYSDFIHTAKENMSGCLVGDHLLERLSALVRRLPPSNFRTCAVLMHHLHRVASHSELNHMSCSNLGIVFGPTLLRPLEGTASLASLVDTPHQTRSVELLITNAESVFGPGDDYQLVPDQTPVEALESSQAPEDSTYPVPSVPSSSCEPSPERSPSKDITDGFLASVPMPVPAMALSAASPASSVSSPPPPPQPQPQPLPTAAAQAPQPAVPAVSQPDDGAAIVTDAVPQTPSVEAAATDFSLPGSASLDNCDSVFVSNASSAAVVDGQGLRAANSDSLSSFEDDDDYDDDDDVILPDQSSASNSQSHTPLLTPHCMAESLQGLTKSAAPTPKYQASSSSSSSLGGAGNLQQTASTTTPIPTPAPPLADMDPAPDTTLPSPMPAVVDSSTWPGPSGRGGSASLPASPTIKPQHTSSSSTGSGDGRMSPSKDARADRFKLEQRRLLSAIKSDPKLGMVVSEGSLSSAHSDPKLSVSSSRDEVDGGCVFLGDDSSPVVQNIVTVHPPPPPPSSTLPGVEKEVLAPTTSYLTDDSSSSATPAEQVPVPVSSEQSPDSIATEATTALLSDKLQVMPGVGEAMGRETVSAAIENKESGAVSASTKPSVTSARDSSTASKPEEKGESSRTGKLSDRTLGLKSPSTTSAGSSVGTGRSGIRLGIGSATKQDSSTSSASSRSSSVTVGGKGSSSPTGKTVSSRQSAASSIGQRHTAITGLSSGGSSPSSSPQTGHSKSLLSRYPGSSTPPPPSSSSSAPRRPVASVPSSCTVLGRSSTGSVPSMLRRSTPTTSSPDSSPRGPSSSSSDSSPASSGLRARGLSRDMGSGDRDSGVGGMGLRASGGNSGVGKTRTGLTSPRSLPSGAGGKSFSGGSSLSSRLGTSGSSKAYSAGLSSSSMASNVGASKAGIALSSSSSAVKRSQSTSASTKSVSGIAMSSEAGAGIGAVASTGSAGPPFQEKSQDQQAGAKDNSSSSSSLPGAKDLSPDRTPRFV